MKPSDEEEVKAWMSKLERAGFNNKIKTFSQKKRAPNRSP